MRLTQLFESMIHLPDSLVDDIMEFMYAYIIDFMATKTDNHHEGHIFLETLDIHPKYPELHERLKFSHTESQIMNAKVGLKSYNFKYNIPEEDKVITLRMVDANDFYYGGYDDDKSLLTLNVHNLKMMLSHEEPKKSFIEYTLKEFHNTIEHELMHFVQFKAFSKIDPRQTQKYDSKDDSFEEYIKYATSAVEILPTLKSEFNTFKTKVEFLERQVSVSDNQRLQLLRFYIGDKSARVDQFSDYIDDFKSSVLWGIKEYNPELWKKASKIMVQEYRKEF